MKIKTILLLFTCILPDCLYAEVILPPDTLGPDKLYRDSTYRRVIKEGTAGLNCYFSYPQGGWQIRKDYGGNAGELEKLDKFMRSSFADTLIYVRRITLTGYCSIEGQLCCQREAGERPCQRVQKLSEQRVRAGETLSGGSALCR